MKEELGQSVLDAVIERPMIVGTASVSTIGTGLSTYLELIPAVLGSLASLVGIIISCSLCYLAWKKDRREARRAVIIDDIIRQRERERLENEN